MILLNNKKIAKNKERLSNFSCLLVSIPLSNTLSFVQIIILNFFLMPTKETLLPMESFSAKKYVSLWFLRMMKEISLSSLFTVSLIFPFFVKDFAVILPFILVLSLNSFIFLSLSANSLTRLMSVLSIIRNVRDSILFTFSVSYSVICNNARNFVIGYIWVRNSFFYHF